MNLKNLAISRQQIIDYICFSVALFVLIFEPWFTADFKHRYGSIAILYYAIEALLIFFCFLMAELLTSHLLRLPADYSKPNSYQYKRVLAGGVICLTLISIVAGQYFTCIEFGTEHWYYFWIDYENHFSLIWVINNFRYNFYIGFVIVLIILLLTRMRMNKYQIEELQTLNSILEKEQDESSEETHTLQSVCLKGDSRESLEVDPRNILYIESLANYLNVVYFEEKNLCQKRIRSSLRNAEETLCEYPYLVHCHRAFMVNIKYITQIAGNSAGLRLSLFSVDKVIPVSKSNIENFKSIVKNETRSHSSASV